MRTLPALLAAALLPTIAHAQDAALEPGTTALDIEGIDVTGGSLLLGRAAYVKARTGGLAVLSGVIRTGSPFGRTQLKGGTLTFDQSSTFRTDGSALTIDGGNFDFRGDSRFLGDGSSITVSGGSLLGFQGSTLRLGDGGSILFTDATRATFGDSSFVVNGGNVEFRGKAGASVGTGSAFTIRGGGLTLSDASTLDVTGGTMTVGDGSMFLRPGTGLSFGRNASLQATRVDVQSSGTISFRTGGNAHFGISSIALGVRASVRVDEDAVVTGRGTTLSVPDRSFGFADLDTLDLACNGTAVVSIDEKGGTRLTCERPAREGESCVGYTDPEGGKWVCEDSCAKNAGTKPTCDRKVALCCG